MKGSAILCCVVGLALALSAVPATAAHMASASVGYYGVYYPVIGGGAIFTLTVKNNASSANAINKVVLDFQTSGFKVVWANGAGWSASSTETTCTFETPPGTPIAPGIAKEFSTKVTLPWTIAQYDFAVTTYDTTAASSSFRTGNKVNVSFGSCGNADAVDLLHASATPTANMLFPLGPDAKYNGAILGDATVSGAKLMDGAVTSDKLAFSSVGTSQLTNSAVSTAQLADASVTEPKIADGAVSNAKLADGAVSGAKIAADAVTDDKIPNLVRTVNLPIMGAQLTGGAAISTDYWWVVLNFPQPGTQSTCGIPITMPADWDPALNPHPYVELVWNATDLAANRGKNVHWRFFHIVRRPASPFVTAYAFQDFNGTTDVANASVVQSTGDALAMMHPDPAYTPTAPNDVVTIVILRMAASGTELPDVAHLIAARLWYLAKR